jgi:hypothetical protein
MKLTKTYLRNLIMEEFQNIQTNEGCGGLSMDDEEEHESEETDLEGLAHRAIAAIHDLATAAGADISIDGGSGEEEVMDIIGVDMEEMEEGRTKKVPFEEGMRLRRLRQKRRGK